MYVTYFLFKMLEFTTCADDVIEEIPNFCFEEVFFEALSVGYFCFEYEFVVVVADLGGIWDTLVMPLEPHMPTDSKLYLRGSSMTYLLSESLI